MSIAMFLLFACVERPYVEVLEPGDGAVVDVGDTVELLAYAWDRLTPPGELRVEIWFGGEPQTLDNPDDTDTDTDTDTPAQVQMIEQDLLVDHSDELRIFVTDGDGLIDTTTIQICVDAADCGQPEATVTEGTAE